MDPARLFPAARRLVQAELAAVAALFVAGLGVFTFIAVADEVSEKEFGLDRAVLGLLRAGGDPATPVGPHWLRVAAEQLTGFGDTSILIAITLIAVGFLLIQRRPGHAALLAVALGGGTVMSETLKVFFARDRPDSAYRIVEVTSQSFPSGHAMLSAVTYLTLGALLARVMTQRRQRAYVLAVAFALAGMVGLTRIYLGVHWLTDVVAGWALGAAWAMACWLAAYAVERFRAYRASTRSAAGAGGEGQGGAEDSIAPAPPSG